MKYSEFYAGIQRLAFQEHKDAHGFYPMRKEQKQFAYGFLRDFMNNNIIDAEDCYQYLRAAGCTREHVEAFEVLGVSNLS